MFYGSVPAEAQAIMNKIVKMWDVSDIYIGCSGNFTLEKFISPLGRFNLHSNDVTLYSLMLGQFFQGKTVELFLSETGAEMFPWLSQYMETDTDRIATMLLMSRIVAYVGKEDHPYYSMMLQENIKQYPVMHEKTVKKLTDSKLSISSYYNGDAVDFVKEAPQDAGFVSFPPVQKGGQGIRERFCQAGADF